MRKNFLKIFIPILTICAILSGCSYLDYYENNSQSYIEQSAQISDNSDIYDLGDSRLYVDFIDVGQADCILLQTDGHAMFIDGGNVADSRLVVSYLKSEGITYLDYVICTHAHEDHCGGLSGALATTDVGTIYAPVTEADTKAYTIFKTKVSEQGLEITHPQAGDSIVLGNNCVITFYAPTTEDVDDLNNTSIVCKAVFGNTSFLFTGDAEREEEQDILDAGYDLSADVLKVGHHGSESSTTYPFLREIMPTYAVISVGADNTYGHPAENTLSRLRDAGATVLRTDESGTISFVTEGNTITYTTEK